MQFCPLREIFSKKKEGNKPRSKLRKSSAPKRDDLINQEKPKNLRAANAEEGLLSVLLRNPDFCKNAFG